MTNKEAIEIMQELRDRYTEIMMSVNKVAPEEGSNGYYGRMRTAVEMAISAMEKREPMQIADKDIQCDEYYCPACGSENICDQYEVSDDFCPVCGQALEKRKRHVTESY